MQAFQLTIGQTYSLTVDQYPHNGKTEVIKGVFEKSFNSYDARFNGATSDVDKYMTYQFSRPNAPQLGIFNYYQFQLHSVE